MAKAYLPVSAKLSLETVWFTRWRVEYDSAKLPPFSKAKPYAENDSESQTYSESTGDSSTREITGLIDETVDSIANFDLGKN